MVRIRLDHSSRSLNIDCLETGWGPDVQAKALAVHGGSEGGWAPEDGAVGVGGISSSAADPETVAVLLDGLSVE